MTYVLPEVLLFAAIGAAMLTLTWRALRESRREGDLTIGFVWMFATVVLTNATTAVAALTGTRAVGADAFFQRTVEYVGPAAVVNEVATPLLVMICAFVILRGLPSGRISPAPVVLLTTLLVGAVAATERGDFVYGGRLALMVLVLTAAFVPPGRDVLAGAAIALALIAAVSGLAPLVQPEYALESCNARKCTALGELLSGLADNPNAFGLLMALAVPTVYFGLRRHGAAAAVLIGILGLSSGSRTSQLAIVAVWLLLVITSRVRGRSAAAVAASFTSLALLAVVAVPTLLSLPSSTFTGRAGLWTYALEQWKLKPWIGYGPDAWRQLVGNGPIVRSAGYSTHNQFVELLYVTGIVGLLLTIVWLVLVIHRWSAQEATVGLALLTAILMVGITERPWSLGQVDGLSWSLVLIMLIALRLGDPPELSANCVMPTQAEANRLRGRR